MLFPMYFRASEAFVEGVNAVESYFFASLDLFISRVPYEGFYFSITEVFLCSSYLPWMQSSSCTSHPSMAMVAGRGQEQDVYMTSR